MTVNDCYYYNIIHSENLDFLFLTMSVVLSGCRWAMVCCIFSGWFSGKVMGRFMELTDTILSSDTA